MNIVISLSHVQLNEITPWFDGGLMYGPFKAWADTLRLFRNGLMAFQYPTRSEIGESETLTLEQVKYILPPDNTIGLPFANPPPPILNRDTPATDGLARLMTVNRYWSESTNMLFRFQLALITVLSS